MALIDQASEVTDQSEFAAHEQTYRMFLRVLWWNVAGVAVILILLASWAG